MSFKEETRTPDLQDWTEKTTCVTRRHAERFLRLCALYVLTEASDYFVLVITEELDDSAWKKRAQRKDKKKTETASTRTYHRNTLHARLLDPALMQ